MNEGKEDVYFCSEQVGTLFNLSNNHVTSGSECYVNKNSRNPKNNLRCWYYYYTPFADERHGEEAHSEGGGI